MSRYTVDKLQLNSSGNSVVFNLSLTRLTDGGGHCKDAKRDQHVTSFTVN